MVSKELVLELWDGGKNCAIATGVGLLQSYNDPDHKVFQSAFLGFGGGMGEGSVCGAVSGTIAAIGKLLFEKGLNDNQIRDKIILLKKQLKDEYSQQSLDCKNFLKDFSVDGKINYSAYGRKESCTLLVGKITELADKILEQ